MFKKIIVLCLVFSSKAVAQSNQPLSVWTQLSIEKKITKKLDGQLSFQTRLAEKVSYVQLYFIDGGLSYSLPKNIDISANFRYFEGRRNESKEFKARKRWYADVAHSFKLAKFKIDNSLRYQTQKKDDADGIYAFDASYLRYKPELSYQLKGRFKPSVSTTFFYNLQNKELDGIRPRADGTYKLNKNNFITLALQYDLDLIDKENNQPILLINYKVKF
jgi:hypothetical protein